MICCSTDGTITVFNESAQNLYGRRHEDAVGQPVDLLLAPGHSADGGRVIARVAAGERIAPFRSEHRRADGSPVSVSVAVSPLRDDDGAPFGASVFVRDISDRIAIESELARTRQVLEERAAELERSNADLEQFAYVASHDLSEPLRTITGMLALLQDECEGRLGDDADHYVARAVAGADRMRSLIDALLTYSRLGQREAELRQVALEAVVAQTLEGLADTISSRGARVEACWPLPEVQADPVELRQIFQNVISNAIKFNDRPAPVVEISTVRDDAMWRIVVADDGIGIPPQFAERVFGPFKRLHTRDAYPGTGIGLAICRRIVERRGGRMWVEPRDGGGTLVSFTIPDAATGEVLP